MRKAIFAVPLFFASLCFAPLAFADYPVYVLKQKATIGIAPDGKPVEFVYYFNDMLQHFQYIFF